MLIEERKLGFKCYKNKLLFPLFVQLNTRRVDGINGDKTDEALKYLGF